MRAEIEMAALADILGRIPLFERSNGARISLSLILRRAARAWRGIGR